VFQRWAMASSFLSFPPIMRSTLGGDCWRLLIHYILSSIGYPWQRDFLWHVVFFVAFEILFFNWLKITLLSPTTSLFLPLFLLVLNADRALLLKDFLSLFNSNKVNNG
jgi:hypothetical protein